MGASGQGSLSSAPRNASGAPFTPASADNGLHVDGTTGKIYLGGTLVDPSTTIEMAGNDFGFQQGGVEQFRIYPDPNGSIEIGPQSGATASVIFVGGSSVQSIFQWVTGGGGTISAVQSNVTGDFFFNVRGPINATLFNLEDTGQTWSFGSNGIERIVFDGLGNTADFKTMTIRTKAPTGGILGSAEWALGDIVAAPAVLDPNQYIEVNVNGVFVKLACIV